MFYIEKDGKRISKDYKFKMQAIIHCFEYKYFYSGGSGDFIGDKYSSRPFLMGNIKIINTKHLK